MSFCNRLCAGQFDVLLLIVLSALAATDSIAAETGQESSRSAPQLTLPPEPGDNPTTPDKVVLGKQLFFDPRLSGDKAMSCATCHLPEKAFTDGAPQSKGSAGKASPRNAPTLVNVGFQSHLMWDGRAESLEEQALLPITSPDEMNQDLSELEIELNEIPAYVEQFQKVFGTGATRQSIAKALAAFQRTLVMRPSAYDQYVRGDHEALSPDAERGRELFFGDAGCSRCHNGPLLSDGKFYRLGIPGDDPGRAAVTSRDEDRGKFKTPPLRNVELTGPYMHDGSLATLQDVVSYYYRGVPLRTAKDTPLDVEPLLGRSYAEIADLVAFLESLTGELPEVTRPELP